jgi:CheY-like chemotaxis protein
LARRNTILRPPGRQKTWPLPLEVIYTSQEHLKKRNNYHVPERLPQDGSAMTTQPDILIVDDNADAAMSLARLLRLFGNEVRTADSGLTALAHMESRSPDVVLLDLGMPGMDGLETARHIREREAWRAIPLIAVTGWGQDHDRRRTEEAGFFAHLVKPVNIQELEGVLQRALATPS